MNSQFAPAVPESFSSNEGCNAPAIVEDPHCVNAI